MDRPSYRRVDSCAGEVEAASNYFYSTRGEADEAPPEPGRSVVILGSGPNRIGQGIEFDYCCVHAAQSFRAQGYEAVMVNCNPETVSTDYDTSDRLYFEPLDEEAVLAVLEREQPVGVCIQFGGQTPLKLARAIERAGFRILGTPFDAIDLAEDRERFGAARRERSACAARSGGSRRPPSRPTAIAARIGYPVLVRPSYVLGGRAMRVCYDGARRRGGDGGASRARCSSTASSRTRSSSTSTRSATARDTYVAAVMEHVEEAGIHSGDSSCVLPAPSDDESVREAVRRLGPALGVVGLLNVQLAIAGGEVYVLEVNPRASRTVPFASKATGVNLVDAACRLAAGATHRRARPAARVAARGPPRQGGRAAVRALPRRRPGARARDALDRRGDGERRRLRHRRSRRPSAPRAGGCRPAGARSSASATATRSAVLPVARALLELGFELVATDRHGDRARRRRHPGRSSSRRATPVVAPRPRAAASTSSSTRPRAATPARDGYAIREAAVVARVPCITTLAVARAAVEAIEKALAEPARTLQERHAQARAS